MNTETHNTGNDPVRVAVDPHTLYLAGGCFWGLEAFLKKIPGVHKTEVGYANGATECPSYEEVCYEETGHAETVAVTYDRDLLSTELLLEAFFKVVDPTSINRQGNDWGTQYRSGIYYTDDNDLPLIENEIKKQRESHRKPIATEVEPLQDFYPAEAYHQDYLDNNPFGYCHINLSAADAFIKEKGLDKPKAADTSEQETQTAYTPAAQEDLRARLTDRQYQVTQQNATEPPFSNEYYATFDKGIYVDITTGEPLFLSSDKFESGCGWPSFSRPIDHQGLTEILDTSHGMMRTEVRNRTSTAHLGHVFTDGPAESGGLRYCINSAALKFIPYEDLDKEGYSDLKPLLD